MMGDLNMKAQELSLKMNSRSFDWFKDNSMPANPKKSSSAPWPETALNNFLRKSTTKLSIVSDFWKHSLMIRLITSTATKKTT